MTQPVFHIKNLYCSYDRDPKNAVAYIADLQIQKGEIVFLLGSSGSGKSTLLEALGLMNNTIAGGDLLFYPDGSAPVNFASLWEAKNLSKASQIRKSNFSFIFQNTNLMENFTAYENVSLSKMIQEDSNQESAMAGAKRLMERVGLPEDVVSTTALSVNLSGGQRQRVAFVRALNSDCTVLFGDEPTGNLDEGNANELMNVVRSYLKEKNLTAIIVSHDINLALNHASRIICLTKNQEKGYGEILPENVYERSFWESKSADEVNLFKQRIRGFYTQQTAKPKTDHASKAPLKLSNGYRSLFLKKEGKDLSGRFHTNFIVLTALLMFTFLAIGFANGSLDYLEKKITNPFVNWLTIDIPNQKGDAKTVNDMVTLINDNKEKFFIKSATSFSERPVTFFAADLRTPVPTAARSVQSYTDPLIRDLMSDKNTTGNGKSGFVSDQDLSVIVTERFMVDNGYPLDAPFVYMEDHVYDERTGKKIEFLLPIGVRAVVKEIAGKAQVAYTNYFDQTYEQVQDNTFDLRRKKDMLLYLATDREKANSIRVALIKYLKTSKWSKDHDFDCQLPVLSHSTHYDGFDIDITPTPTLAYDEWLPFYRDISAVIPAAILQHCGYYFRYYDFDKDFSQEPQSDKLSINFSKLDKVRAFANFCLIRFNDQDERKSGRVMEVDLSNVKEKENFNFLSHITIIISYILIFFGAVSVSLFVFNLLKMHLSKVKMNIGTFKAFGLSNSEAQNIYFIIVLGFLLLSIIVALALAAGLGYVLDQILLHSWGDVIESGVSYFKLLYLYTYITLGLIFASALTVSWFTIRSMLSKSPGDLIYNR